MPTRWYFVHACIRSVRANKAVLEALFDEEANKELLDRYSRPAAPSRESSDLRPTTYFGIRSRSYCDFLILSSKPFECLSLMHRRHRPCTTSFGASATKKSTSRAIQASHQASSAHAENTSSIGGTACTRTRSASHSTSTRTQTTNCLKGQTTKTQ